MSYIVGIRGDKMSEIDMQQIAIERIKAGGNFFLGGKGGVGKSWVIDQVTDNRTVKCAPTGAAAINIGGITCHSLFGLPLSLPEEEDKYTISKRLKSTIKEGGITRIILDEVSILRADHLDLIDSKLKVLMCNKKPFGGIQIVLVGDFYQIEPIVHWTEEHHYYERYESGFCFTAKSWNFDCLELTKSYRNIDKNQLSVLESIRTRDKWHEKAVNWVNKVAKPYVIKDSNLHLCCFNRDADALNSIMYKVIKAPETKYKSYITDQFDGAKPVKDIVKLKVGCRVLIKANDAEAGHVNGDRGCVTELGDKYVRVLIDRTSQDVIVSYSRWEQFDYKVSKDGLQKVVKGVYNQMPISLGYAISIHNSQGSTLEDVAIDFGTGCFTHGQAYVALSRVKDLKNISLVNELDYDSIICDTLVQQFYEGVDK